MNELTLQLFIAAAKILWLSLAILVIAALIDAWRRRPCYLGHDWEYGRVRVRRTRTCKKCNRYQSMPPALGCWFDHGIDGQSPGDAEAWKVQRDAQV